MLRWFSLAAVLALTSCQSVSTAACDCPKPVPCRPLDLGTCHTPPGDMMPMDGAISTDLTSAPDMTTRCITCMSDLDCTASLCLMMGSCVAGKCVFTARDRAKLAVRADHRS